MPLPCCPENLAKRIVTCSNIQHSQGQTVRQTRLRFRKAQEHVLCVSCQQSVVRVVMGEVSHFLLQCKEIETKLPCVVDADLGLSRVLIYAGLVA